YEQNVSFHVCYPSLPSSRSLTSFSKNRQWLPGVLMPGSRPDFAHRDTVFRSTRNRSATSCGVRSLFSLFILPPLLLDQLAGHMVPCGTMTNEPDDTERFITPLDNHRRIVLVKP